MTTANPELEQVGVRLETLRSWVRHGTLQDVRSIVGFYTKNRERFLPVDPERPAIFYQESFWRSQVRLNLEEYTADRALRLFIFPKAEPGRVIGNISFSNFVRGVGQYCTLGYSVDGDYEGTGMMSEALRASIDFTFRSLNMHRIEANYMPHNTRSGKLLRRFGFIVEGYSRDYLMINGQWEDHVRTALPNPHWHGS